MKAVKLPFYGYSLHSPCPQSHFYYQGGSLLLLHEQICPEQFPHFITIHPPSFFTKTRWVPILFSHMVGNHIWVVVEACTRHTEWWWDICHINDLLARGPSSRKFGVKRNRILCIPPAVIVLCQEFQNWNMKCRVCVSYKVSNMAFLLPARAHFHITPFPWQV